MAPQRPTCSGVQVRSTAEANIIFHGVSLGILPMVTRRLDSDERRAICTGSVFVWEERGPNAELTGLGIERWTDSISWGPSRVRDDFLYYQERPRPSGADRDGSDSDETLPDRNRALVKQTYSVYVETERGRRKWHMIAYFTADTVSQLRTVYDCPRLANLVAPPGLYVRARISRNPGRGRPPSTESPPNGVVVAPTLSRPSLPPLSYLETLAPTPRHPIDEHALNALFSFLNPLDFVPSHRYF